MEMEMSAVFQLPLASELDGSMLNLATQKVLKMSLQAIMIFTWVDYTPSKYGDYPFPMWADIMGWLMTMTSVSAIPLVMLYKICTTESQGSLWQVSVFGSFLFSTIL